MSTPNNASTIVHILSHLDANPGKILTKDAQNEYLKNLTSTYMCYYRSSTFGCTLHNETSLRKALTSIMASYTRLGVDVRPGKSAVDELFERGSEMLDEKYVEGLKEAAKGQVFVKKIVEEDTCSDEDHVEDEAIRKWIEASSGSDEDWEPGSKRTRAARKRTVQASKKVESVHSLPTPPAAPKKKRTSPPSRYDSSTDRSESPLGHKRPAPVVHRRPSTSCPSEGSSCDDADDESCNKRVRVWRKSVRSSQRAEAVLRKLSTLFEQDKLRTVQPVVPECVERSTPTLKSDTIPTPDLRVQIAELNESIKSSAEKYVAGHPATHANLITRPPPELETLYAQVFNTSDWKSIATHLQSRGGLSAADLVRSLVSAFMFTRIFTKAGSLPWLAPEVAKMFKILKKRLPAQSGDRDINSDVACVFEDEHFTTSIIKPQAKTLASECLLVLNDHLSTLSGSRRRCEVGMRFREGLELAFEKALRLQSCLSLGMESHRWAWSTIGSGLGSEGVPTADVKGLSERVALTLFPAVLWEDGKTSGSVPAVVAMS